MCQNSSRSVYSVAVWRRKTPNFAIFGLQHFVVLPVGGILRKLKNYKSSPSNGIKFVSVLQHLHGEIGHTISDIQKCDGQTNRQTKN